MRGVQITSGHNDFSFSVAADRKLSLSVSNPAEMWSVQKPNCTADTQRRGDVLTENMKSSAHATHTWSTDLKLFQCRPYFTRIGR